ncbi:MAG: autotransporter outer membrane beta-barrel domain-containing protein, partial [Wohlfahrtiimonas sp.]
DNSSGLIINVEDIGGNGITVNTSGKVHSGASVNIKSKQGQSALVLKGDTTQITQSGNLSSNSETSAVVELKDLTSTQDINFTNLGSIKVSDDANAPAGLVAINANIGKNINITNGESGTTKGVITGVVALGDQKNQVTLFGGSKADEIVATAGETSVMLKDVKREQSDELFNKLTAGNGVNDAIELSATSSQAGKSSHYALTQAKSDEIKGFEQLKIHANSTFELDNSDIALNEFALDGGIHLEDATGTLFVNQSQATGKNTFNHNLYGNGVLKTDINGKEFAFDTTKANLIGDKFTGKLQLENAVFNLKNENTKALTNATLSIGQKAHTIVED